MFGISGTELVIIVAFVLFIFGPDKLPEFARTIGQFIREFKRAQENMEAVLRAEMYPTKQRASETGPGPNSAPKASSNIISAIDDEEEEDEE